MKLVIFDFDGVLNTSPEIKKVLIELHSKYMLAIVSSTSTRSIQNYLEEEKLAGVFSDIAGADVYGSKTSKIKALLGKYKVVPGEAVYITDTVGDILEAQEGEVKSIAITWGYQDEQTLLKAKPDKIISNPEDLINAIETI